MESSDEEMDSPRGFSEEKKYENYLQIIRAIHFIEHGERITEDWMEDNKTIILTWRDWIENFATLNAEVEDEIFRKKCRDAETIMQYLCHSIRIQKTFDPKAYLIFLHHLKYICDTLFSDDEMEQMMSMLSM